MNRLLIIAVLFAGLSLQAASTVITNVGGITQRTIITNTVTRGLVQWLDGETVTWVSGNPTNTDKSGLGNHGGLVNFTKTNSFIPGPRGQAFSFAGSAGNDHIQCGSGASLDDMTNGLTLTFWMRTPATTLGYIWMKGAGAGGKRVWISNGYPLRMAFIVDAASDYTAVCNGFIETNKTLFVCMTWDGGMVSNSTSFWLNGMQARLNSVTAGSGAIASDAANNETWGGYASDGSFAGMLDEMRVYTNVLTQAEIISLYQEGLAQFGPRSDPLTNGTWSADVFLNLNDQTPGTVVSPVLLTNVSAGMTNTSMGPWAWSSAYPYSTSAWTVVDVGQFNLINPVTAGGVTHSWQTRAFAFNCQSGAYRGGWTCTLPTIPAQFGYSNFTAVCYFKTTRTYKFGQTGGHDIMDIGTPSSQLVSQVLEDLNFWTKGHSVSNGVSIGGYRQWFYAGYWYQMVLCWDTEHGLGHLWLRTCDDWPVPSERRQIINYSLSSLPANTNASYWAVTDNTHGMFGDGTNYWAGWTVLRGNASQLGLKMRTNYLTGGVQ